MLVNLKVKVLGMWHIAGGNMRALKSLKVRFMGKEVTCSALFDTGSGITAVQRIFFEKNFGKSWDVLERPLTLFWINGETIKVDKHAQLVIIVDGYPLPETVMVIDDFKEEIEIEGRKVKMPELIIGSGTMDKYGIKLDPREGVKLTGAVLLA